MGQPPLCPADPTPQSEPLDERQVANSAGGYAYPVDDMTRLRRFLILGSEGGSYYADERKLTLENAAAVKRRITSSENSGIDAVGEIIAFSQARRAPKPGPLLFALAMAASYVSYGFKVIKNYGLELTHRKAMASSRELLWRCLGRIAERWRRERDIRVKRGGLFDPRDSQRVGYCPEHGAAIPEYAGGDATEAAAATRVEIGPVHVLLAYDSVSD